MLDEPGRQFGESVAARRGALGYSVERLARETEGQVAERTIRNIESGRLPSVGNALLVADALRTTLGALFGETEDSPFISELRALETQLDERGREAVLAVARSQASVRPSEINPDARRAITAAEAIERERLADEAHPKPSRRRAAEDEPRELGRDVR